MARWKHNSAIGAACVSGRMPVHGCTPLKALAEPNFVPKLAPKVDQFNIQPGFDVAMLVVRHVPFTWIVDETTVAPDAMQIALLVCT